ncbi:MAG: tetratricopeptide repeat protein [Desulfovibrionaceae bacterium]|nr:tetratricopeptide repeat protein [Desulfovibrionaceae bacterium]
MAKEPVFLGIYSRQVPGEKDTEGRWQVWELEDGRFLAQRTARGGEGGTLPEAVDSDTFFKEFRVQAAFKRAAAGKKTEKRPVPTAEPWKAAFRSISGGDSQEDVYLNTAFTKKRDAPKTDGPGKAPATGISDLEIEKMLYPRWEGIKTRDAVTPPEKPRPAPAPADIALTENEMRSDFSLALMRLRNNRHAAIEDLEKILKRKAPFKAEHKHMFSDFGTALRRKKVNALACRFHERARELSPNDEHILFNLARVLYDSGKFAQAHEQLRKAVEIASDFKYGKDFLEYIELRHKNFL